MATGLPNWKYSQECEEEDVVHSSAHILCRIRSRRYARDRRTLICLTGTTGMILILLTIVALIVLRVIPTTTDRQVFRNITVQWNGKEYFHLVEDLTWQNARIACEIWGGDLISIHSEEESSFVKGLLQGNCNPEKCPGGNCYPLEDCNRWDYWIWTGLHKMDQNGDFSWSDGTAVDFVAWDKSVLPEQPNVGQGAFCVIQSDYDGGWYNNRCAGPFKSVCKRKL